jgi:hypothetical protein
MTSTLKIIGHDCLNIETNLTEAERNLLAAQEQTIRQDIRAFLRVGIALTAIRDNRLYREQFATFEEYCHTKWKLPRAEAYRLMTAAGVVLHLDTDEPPTTVAQTLALKEVPEAERAETWKKAKTLAHNGKVKAPHIRLAANHQTGKVETLDRREWYPRLLSAVEQMRDLLTAFYGAGGESALEPEDRTPDELRHLATLGKETAGLISQFFTEVVPWEDLSGNVIDVTPMLVEEKGDPIEDTMPQAEENPIREVASEPAPPVDPLRTRNEEVDAIVLAFRADHPGASNAETAEGTDIGIGPINRSLARLRQTGRLPKTTTAPHSRTPRPKPTLAEASLT